MGKVEVKKNNRINWIDMAKGYGIILVIIGHVNFCNSNNLPHWMELLLCEIYSFHMPLFFMISGYLLNVKKYSPKEFIIKRAKGIMIPYLVLGITIVIICWGFYTGFDFSELGGYVIQLLVQKRFNVIWYLLCLFIAEVIFFYIVRMVNNTIWKIMCICSIIAAMGLVYYHFGGVYLPWNIDIVPFALFFLALGYSFKNVPFKSDIKWFIAAVIINISCVVCNYKLANTYLEMFRGSYGIVPLTILGSIAGVYMVYYIADRKQFKSISYIGHYSLIFFGLHQCFTLPVVDMVVSGFGWKNTILNSLPWGIIYLIVSVFISVIVLGIVRVGVSKTPLKNVL